MDRTCFTIGGHSRDPYFQIAVTLTGIAFLFGFQQVPTNKFHPPQFTVYFGPVTLFWQGAWTDAMLEASAQEEEVADAMRCPRCLCTCEMDPHLGKVCGECGWKEGDDEDV